MNTSFFHILLSCLVSIFMYSQSKPNILWIVTDDHRADALASYNKATRGKKESALGYVLSPNIDKLASEGVMFVNAYTNSPACGPSRGSMASGRYPFRTGHFGFVLTHQNPDFVRPTFSQTLRSEGYVTAAFGKEDSYIFRWGPGQGFHDAGQYDYKVHFKHDLQKNGIGDFWNQPAYIKGTWKKAGTKEHIKLADGTIHSYFIKKKEGEISPEDSEAKSAFENRFKVLRSYTRFNNDLIIGGENPLPANQTIDAKIVEELKLYLANPNAPFTTTWGATRKGANPNKPLMINLGFHLPHTPVLPPKKYRDRFKTKTYKVPDFDEKELNNQPPQIQRLFKNLNFSNLTAEEKQQAIQDYYAFCAHGDALIGQAVEAFKTYCEDNNQEYLILFTVGDHGWHLGEQGIEAKFGPWNKSNNGALIVVSSDKEKVPQGLVQRQWVEYVDIAPTLLSSAGVNIQHQQYSYLDGHSLFKFMGNQKEYRDYVVGEINLVAGHRAYLRSKDFAFSMRTRPQRKAGPNENIKWALKCPVEKAELVLYDLRIDPEERHNVAAQKEYRELASWFRKKLGNIVLGDGRIECDWSQANVFSVSTFAKGAHDGKLNIPKALVPKKKTNAIVFNYD